MAKNSILTGIELNGVFYSLGKNVYEELDMTLARFAELLGRDFYCPALASEPTPEVVSYTDTDGGQHSFRLGQCCIYPDDESSDGWGFSIAKHIETDADGLPASIVWQKFINEAPMGKEAVYSLFGLPVE